MKISVVVPQKINMELPRDSAIPLRGAHLKNKSRDSNRSCVHWCSYQHYSQQLKYKNNQISIDRWMGQQNMVWKYNVVLFSLKKEWNSDTCYHMDKPWRHYAMRNKPNTKR